MKKLLIDVQLKQLRYELKKLQSSLMYKIEEKENTLI